MKEVKNKKKELDNKNNFFQPSPTVRQAEQQRLTGTALASVTVFLRQEYSMISTGSDFTIDSNDETIRQILDRHMSQFSEAWKTLGQK